jgi:hypothetical protein
MLYLCNISQVKVNSFPISYFYYKTSLNTFLLYLNVFHTFT